MKLKSLLLTFLFMAGCGSLSAQTIKAEHLSDKHTMLRVSPTSRFLLIPVEEKEEIAHVILICNNQSVMDFNVRLAVDKVDYYVPVDLDAYTNRQSPLLFDVTFHVDRHKTGSVKNFVCWKEIRLSDTFDTTNREQYRPVYHHTPVYGWMNDPNGMFYKDGVYHLYYQWNPYGSMWENMTWGHSTSKDLLHWEAQPTAIVPDALGTIFSGSCVVDKQNTAGFGKGAVVAYYTSAGQHQTQSMAVSNDNGIHFKKVADNPILVSNEPDFRDPKAFWNPEIQKWNLVLAVGQEMRIYSSPNLKDWKYESSFGKGYGCHEGVWECPDLMKLQVRGTDKQKWMLICNINPGGPFGGSATQYFIGEFDGHTFTCEHQDTRWMDLGKDHYATVTFDNAPDGRRIALAWMSNWQYANQVPTRQFRSGNSVPRDLDLYEYEGQTYCGVTPSRELLTMRGKKIKNPTEACEVVVEVKGTTELVLSNAKGEKVVLLYDAKTKKMSFDRMMSGKVDFSESFPCVTTADVKGNVRQLRIFIDRCSIEVLDAEGQIAMTNLVFPTEPYNQLKVKGGKATIYELK